MYGRPKKTYGKNVGRWHEIDDEYGKTTTCGQKYTVISWEFVDELPDSELQNACRHCSSGGSVLAGTKRSFKPRKGNHPQPSRHLSEIS